MKGHRRAQAVVDAVPTQADLLAALARAKADPVRQWEKMVLAQQEAYAEIAEKLKSVEPGTLNDLIRWGAGVEEDFAACYAQEALGAVKAGRPILAICQFQLEAIESRQHNNTWRLGSSSRFANAIEGAQAEFARSYRDKLLWWIEDIKTTRAEAEVL